MLRPVRIRHYLEVMQAKGFAASAVLAQTGIDAERLADPGYLIDEPQCRRVILNLLALTGDHGIGFDTGVQTEPSDLGIIGYAVMSCATMRQTLGLWGQYGQALVGMLSRLAQTETLQGLAVSVVLPRKADPVFVFCAEEVLAMMVKFAGLLVRCDKVIQSMRLSYPAPAHSQRYHDLFRCPIQFDADETCAVLAPEWLDRPMRSNDEEFNRICLTHCGEILQQIEHTGPVVSRLRSHFLRAPGALPSLMDAAQALGLSSRTLRRHLQDEGASYRQLVEDFRKDLACEYLRSTRMTTKEVAFLLGYADPATFRRAFRVWTGQTPGDFRNAALAPS